MDDRSSGSVIPQDDATRVLSEAGLVGPGLTCALERIDESQDLDTQVLRIEDECARQRQLGEALAGQRQDLTDTQRTCLVDSITGLAPDAVASLYAAAMNPASGNGQTGLTEFLMQCGVAVD